MFFYPHLPARVLFFLLVEAGEVIEYSPGPSSGVGVPLQENYLHISYNVNCLIQKIIGRKLLDLLVAQSITITLLLGDKDIGMKLVTQVSITWLSLKWLAAALVLEAEWSTV